MGTDRGGTVAGGSSGGVSGERRADLGRDLRRLAALLALLTLTAVTPLRGQAVEVATGGLVGRWAATTEAINTQTGQQVLLRAAIQFFPDSSFTATLTSEDGSGETGRTAITKGQYRTIQDPWGNPMICVRRDDGRDRPHCQPYRVVSGRLEWGSLVFGPDTSTQPT